MTNLSNELPLQVIFPHHQTTCLLYPILAYLYQDQMSNDDLTHMKIFAPSTKSLGFYHLGLD